MSSSSSKSSSTSTEYHDVWVDSLNQWLVDSGWPSSLTRIVSEFVSGTRVYQHTLAVSYCQRFDFRHGCSHDTRVHLLDLRPEAGPPDWQALSVFRIESDTMRWMGPSTTETAASPVMPMAIGAEGAIVVGNRRTHTKHSAVGLHDVLSGRGVAVYYSPHALFEVSSSSFDPKKRRFRVHVGNMMYTWGDRPDRCRCKKTTQSESKAITCSGEAPPASSWTPLHMSHTVLRRDTDVNKWHRSATEKEIVLWSGTEGSSSRVRFWTFSIPDHHWERVEELELAVDLLPFALCGPMKSHLFHKENRLVWVLATCYSQDDIREHLAKHPTTERTRTLQKGLSHACHVWSLELESPLTWRHVHSRESWEIPLSYPWTFA